MDLGPDIYIIKGLDSRKQSVLLLCPLVCLFDKINEHGQGALVVRQQCHRVLEADGFPVPGHFKACDSQGKQSCLS